MTSAYGALEARFARLDGIDGALAVLNWDYATVMPDGGAAARGEQQATLKSLSHEILSAPEVQDDLAAAADDPGLDDWQRANLREMRRRHVRACALPSDLVAAMARTVAQSEMVWRGAREDSDFARLRPSLQGVLRLVREEAQGYADRLGTSPYAALMDGYEPGLTPERVDALFTPLVETLPDLLDRVLEHQAGMAVPVEPDGVFPVEIQRAFAKNLMAAVGFDFAHGRLDESHHPFCGGVPDDIRITTRWEVDNPARGLMGVLHETGHALYEAGRPRAWRGQPVGEARGIVAHESQSLLVEMQACRSAEFIAYLGPALQAAYDRPEPAFAPGNLLRLYTRVARSFIRVDADEVTYPLHVILRYRLEQDMIEGRLDVADLPEAWNAGMVALLGVTPPDDRRGCLQDIHWPGGAFGYFPCYTLGALMAAQLYQAACAAVPDIPLELAHGRFEPLVAWLRAHVHAQGSRLTLDELVETATGAPLGAEPFLDHLRRRYLG
jgi:carboxypeptidase Taq